MKSLTISHAGSLPTGQVLGLLATSDAGLSSAEAARRLDQFGPNVVSEHHTRWWAVLWRQLRSPLLGLLLGAAAVSFFVGERTDATVIGVIVVFSAGLGFGNEYRAERVAASLQERIHHQTLTRREGQWASVDITDLTPGDVVQLRLGDIVPADLRLLEANALECDESVLTGESLPAMKNVEPTHAGGTVSELSGCALMGTVVRGGSGRGVVVTTGDQAEFGQVASELTARLPETEFQVGLRKFSLLLVKIAAVLTTLIFAFNVILHRPLLDALLFSLAIAVGITPQLLPAVVSTCLAAGSRLLAKKKVLVKRLVCIEDLGDIDILFTDKTGTLTQGRISFLRGVGLAGTASDEPLYWGLLCNEANVESEVAVGGNALDMALWESAASQQHRSRALASRRLAAAPFDHDRQVTSMLVEDDSGQRTLIVKGAPEAVLGRCLDVPEALRSALAAEFASGNRVIAIAARPAPGLVAITPADEQGLGLLGLLVFLDAPKPEAAGALKRLADLDVTVKVITGDNPAVAVKVCEDLGLEVYGVLTGAEMDRLADDELATAIRSTTVFARMSPEQKARIVRVRHHAGGDVAFLGDGVNDAPALRAADVGISVDSASDIAKASADVILLAKDLNVLADGVVEGRRVFANTIKYILMGTSSNFGNMFSAAGASLFLPFLPMLPSQILLNNLLYDTSQLAIPTDEVDPEQLAKPSHWDLSFIRRFMLVFGPISSIFDFGIFAVLLWFLHSDVAQFRSGWFVESLATQTLVIFVIRTRKVPFFRSRPSRSLLIAALGVIVVGALLPATPIASELGFSPLPFSFFAILVGMVLSYLTLIELAKSWFFDRFKPTSRTRTELGPVHPRPVPLERTTAGSADNSEEMSQV